MKQIGLVLQGIGALASYEVGVVDRFFQDREFHPTVVSGMSIGAVNAAVIAGAKGEPIVSLKKMWDEFATDAPPFLPEVTEHFLGMFSNNTMYTPRQDLANRAKWTSFYSDEPLHGMIRRYVDFDRINSRRGPRLLLLAACVETADIEVFDSHKQEITVEHVAASASLPPGFPMVEIDGKHYWGGGLFATNTLVHSIRALDPSPEVKRELFVVNMVPDRAPLPTDLSEALNRVFEMILCGEMRADVHALVRDNDFAEALHAVDRSLAPDSPIRQMPGYQHLVRYRSIERVIVVENSDPKLVTSPFVFGRDLIKERMAAGYVDADAVLVREGKGPDRRRHT